MEFFQSLGYRHPGYSKNFSDLFFGHIAFIPKVDQFLFLVIQLFNGITQFFKPEVLDTGIFHGTSNRNSRIRHRFKLAFTQMSPILPCFRLVPLPFLFKVVCDLPWH